MAKAGAASKHPCLTRRRSRPAFGKIPTNSTVVATIRSWRSRGRIVWDRVLGTGFQVRGSFRERDIDNERSGESLGLEETERDLLDRNGDVYQLEISYEIPVNGQHNLRPRIRLIDRDLDGKAMAQDGVAVGLTHEYMADGLIWQGDVSYAELESDEENPGFGKDNDMERVAITGVLLFPGAFGWKHWIPNLSVAYASEDSDISFYDAKTWVVSAAILRSF